MAGPFTTIELGDGASVDLFLLRYDEDGRLLSPKAEKEIKDRLDDGYTDVFVFSHGWNNTFDDALSRYKNFIEGYAKQRKKLSLPTPAGYKPLLIGVIWPSTSFLFPWEHGPKIAGAPDKEAAETEEMLRLVLAGLEPDDRAKLVEILDGAESLNREQAEAAAALVLKGLRPEVDTDDSSKIPSKEEVVAAWAALEGAQTPKSQDPDDFRGGIAAGGTPAEQEIRAAAGINLDPRNLLRTGTVWLVKDRAGKVGSHGVAPLLEAILKSEARLHLVGHSFGARVLLSALTTQKATQKAHSMLLLQPAVNRWCFAHTVIDRGVPGGYRPVLDRVEQPILATYSKNDKPLHEVFHLAVRGSSLGEPDIAAVGDTKRYGALGGYGPAGIDDRLTTRDMVAEGTSYELDGVTGVVQLNGSVEIAGEPAIGGHGDINSRFTWWALHSLTGRP